MLIGGGYGRGDDEADLLEVAEERMEVVRRIDNVCG